jgi:hypothetical protein
MAFFAANTAPAGWLECNGAAQKEAHDREFKEMKESFKSVIAKLDNIEGALRK